MAREDTPSAVHLAHEDTPSPSLCADVLCLVFDYVAKQYSEDPSRNFTTEHRTDPQWFVNTADLAAAALVCRGWAQPARKALYDTVVCCNDGHVEPRDARFAWTMRTCPHLRPLLHRFSTWFVAPGIPDRALWIYWLYLLPEGQLHHFRCKWLAANTTQAAFAFGAPAVRSVTRLDLLGFMVTRDILMTCITFPSLQTLQLDEIKYEDVAPREVPLTLTLTPTCRNLSISLPSSMNDRLFSLIIAACGPQLASLELSVRYYPRGAGSPLAETMLAHALILHTGRLEKFALSGLKESWTFPMDELVQRNPGLTHVYCPASAVTDRFFACLPRGLQVLGFQIGFPNPYPSYPIPCHYERELLAYIALATTRGERALRVVYLRFHADWTCIHLGEATVLVRQGWKNVVDQCERHGVRCCITDCAEQRWDKRLGELHDFEWDEFSHSPESVADATKL